jgi:hypothetical protein
MLNPANVNLLRANQFFKCLQGSFQILQIIVFGQLLPFQMFLGGIIRQGGSEVLDKLEACCTVTQQLVLTTANDAHCLLPSQL